MPKHTLATVQTDGSTDPADPCGPYQAARFSDSGGLTQFGCSVETLPPGSTSSVKHWHQNTDEMVYVLSGRVEVTEGTDSYELLPGEAATFKAGVPAAHCLKNTSDAPASYLVVGSRAAQDQVTYPDADRVLALSRAPDGSVTERRFTTLSGAPAASPYES